MSSPRHSLTLGGVHTGPLPWEGDTKEKVFLSPRRTLCDIKDMCRQRCVYHENQASVMRIVEYSLQIPLLIITSAATVIATLIPIANMHSIKTQICLAASTALATVLASVYRLYNPGVRHVEHESCERMYRILARDVSVRLVTFNSDAKDMTRDDYFKIVLRDCQRVLDYIQSIEVAL